MSASREESPKGDFYVVALKPDRNLSDSIENAKSNSLKSVGDQKYLSHPPHMTLYVGAFRDVMSVIQCVKSLADEHNPINIRINGWHSFNADSLTGGRTLVCNLQETDRPKLRNMQSKLIADLAQRREKELSQSRYRPFFDLLEPHRKQAVIDTGFPFVGDDWIPHLTIASFDVGSWPSAWQKLESEAPNGNFLLVGFEIFILENDFPKTIQFIPFSERH